jgi:hypothetical protein
MNKIAQTAIFLFATIQSKNVIKVFAFLLMHSFVSNSFALENKFEVLVCGGPHPSLQMNLLQYDNGFLIMNDLASGALVLERQYIDHTVSQENDLAQIQKAVDTYSPFPKKVVSEIHAFAANSDHKIGVSFIEFIDGDVDVSFFDSKEKKWIQYRKSQFCQ